MCLEAPTELADLGVDRAEDMCNVVLGVVVVSTVGEVPDQA